MLHCNKSLLLFPSTAGMSLTKLSLAGNNSQPGRVWLVTSRLGTGKTITFFTVYKMSKERCSDGPEQRRDRELRYRTREEDVQSHLCRIRGRPGRSTATSVSRVYWMIYRGRGFLAVVGMIRLLAHPHLSSLPSATCLSFSVFLFIAGRDYWREGGGGGGVEEPNHTTARKPGPLETI